MREGWGQSHSSSQISFSACRGLNSKFQGSPSRPSEQVLVFTSTSPEMNPKGAERRNSISHLKPEVENPLYFLGSHLCVPLSERWSACSNPSHPKAFFKAPLSSSRMLRLSQPCDAGASGKLKADRIPASVACWAVIEEEDQVGWSKCGPSFSKRAPEQPCWKEGPSPPAR